MPQLTSRHQPPKLCVNFRPASPGFNLPRSVVPLQTASDAEATDGGEGKGEGGDEVGEGAFFLPRGAAPRPGGKRRRARLHVKPQVRSRSSMCSLYAMVCDLCWTWRRGTDSRATMWVLTRGHPQLHPCRSPVRGLVCVA